MLYYLWVVGMTEATYISLLRGFIGALYRLARDPHTDRYWRRQYTYIARRLQNAAHLPPEQFRPIVVGLIARCYALQRHYVNLHKRTFSRYFYEKFLDYAVKFKELGDALRDLLRVIDDRIRQSYLPPYERTWAAYA